MTISNGSSNDANDLLNVYQHGGNAIIGKGGVLYIPVIINNTSGVRNVYLYLYGRKRGPSSGLSNQGGGDAHYHDMDTADNKFDLVGSGPPTTYVFGSSGVTFSTNPSALSSGSKVTTGILNNTVTDTNVPKDVEIWIDGVEYTGTIGDPNGKGATMYDNVNADWGVNGTTEWSTGRLNLTSVISWTAGEHYIEIKENGSIGGTLVYQVMVNVGY